MSMGRSALLVGGLLVLAGALIGCGEQSIAEAGRDRARAWDVSALPRLDGSTSTGPLARLVVQRLTSSGKASNRPSTQPATAPAVFMPGGPTMETRAQANMLVRERFLGVLPERPSGTHGAYEKLIARETDLILVARKPSNDELASAISAGVELDVQPVARDGFVFLLNEENPVDGFTLDEARRIFSGEIQNWNEVGGPDMEILAYHRQPNSGSRELLDELVMQQTPVPQAMSTRVLVDMLGPIQRVSASPQTVSYSVFYYTRFMVPEDKIKLAAIDDVAPTSDSIAGGTYPLATQVYAVTLGGKSPDSPAARLRGWLLSPAGQAVIAESGYVPLAPK